jgi:hypothetical protein
MGHTLAGLCYPIPNDSARTCDRCQAMFSLSHAMWVAVRLMRILGGSAMPVNL